MISHEKTGRWHSSIYYLYSNIAQPGSMALIMESFLGVSNALWVYVDSLLFLSNVVSFFVNVFFKKNVLNQMEMLLRLQDGSFLWDCCWCLDGSSVSRADLKF